MADTVITIEGAEYEKFLLSLGQPEYRHLRFGQAFYNHFKLREMVDKKIPDKLYNAGSDGEAHDLIRKHIRFH